jgi:hypothetical protein
VATQFFSAAEVRKLESWPVEFGRDRLAVQLGVPVGALAS